LAHLEELAAKQKNTELRCTAFRPRLPWSPSLKNAATPRQPCHPAIRSEACCASNLNPNRFTWLRRGFVPCGPCPAPKYNPPKGTRETICGMSYVWDLFRHAAKAV